MTNRIFADAAHLYVNAGYPVIPVNGKAPFIKSFGSFAHNLPSEKTLRDWIEKHPNANVALVTGTPAPGGTITAAVDIDVDDKTLQFIMEVVGPCPAMRKGKKGLNLYVRVPKGTKTTVLKRYDAEPAGSILTNGSLSVLPPSIHPDTQKPYEWVGLKPLYNVGLDELPLLSADKIKFITAVLASEQGAQLKRGSPTNDASFTLAARVARLVDEATWCRAITALLPDGYAGDLLEQLPRHHASALEKGFKGGAAGIYAPGTEGPLPLGCTKDNRFAFLDQRLNTIKLKSSAQLVSPGELLELASREFWQSVAGSEKGYNAPVIADMLIAACLECGKIDPTRIRGIGVWREKDAKIVRNFSGPVPERGWYIYTRFDEFASLDGKAVDPKDVLRWLRRFRWKHRDMSMLLFGWLCYAPICGALKSRPHMFLTGPKNSGKTTLLVGIEGLLEPLCLKFDGSVTTEAGIRQKLEENARPVILDEFEIGRPGHRQRIMDLARSAFSANAAGVKGTPSGKHMEFLLTTTFLFAGINVQRENAANSSRIFTVELEPHDNSPEVSREIERDRQAFTEQATDWCLRRIEQVEVTLDAINVLSLHMPQIDTRAKSNLAICLGAAFVGLEGRVPTEEDAVKWVKRHKGIIEDHAKEHEQNDSEDCLSHLLSHTLALEPDRKCNVWELIASVKEVPPFMRKDAPKDDSLQTYGMRVEKGMLYVADTHSYLEKIFKDTTWASGGWRAQFIRRPGAVEARRYFQGTQRRAVGIPLSGINFTGARSPWDGTRWDDH